jgi:hypothetical protein
MLVYWSGGKPNVGDELNAWLWPRIAPAGLTLDDSVEFFGIGSILSEPYLSRTTKSKIIFGSGKRDASPIRDDILARCEIKFIRGPLSAIALGLPESAAITDPAALMPLHYQPETVVPRPGRIGFVPHLSMPQSQAQAITEALDLFLILPSFCVEKFISELFSCTAVVAEAMHGAILADSYRIPWMGCSYSSFLHEGETNAFKWNDWMRSMKIQTRRSKALQLPVGHLHPRIGRIINPFMTLPYITSLKRHISEGRWTLSTDETLNTKQGQLLERVEGLRQRSFRI